MLVSLALFQLSTRKKYYFNELTFADHNVFRICACKSSCLFWYAEICLSVRYVKYIITFRIMSLLAYLPNDSSERLLSIVFLLFQLTFIGSDDVAALLVKWIRENVNICVTGVSQILHWYYLQSVSVLSSFNETEFLLKPLAKISCYQS